MLTDERLRVARELLGAGTAAAVVARTLGIGRTTLYRHVNPTGTHPVPVGIPAS